MQLSATRSYSDQGRGKYGADEPHEPIFFFFFCSFDDLVLSRPTHLPVEKSCRAPVCVEVLKYRLESDELSHAQNIGTKAPHYT